MYQDSPQGVKAYGENKHIFEHHTMYFATDPKKIMVRRVDL
jgi:hypothetical protein